MIPVITRFFNRRMITFSISGITFAENVSLSLSSFNGTFPTLFTSIFAPLVVSKAYLYEFYLSML